MMDSKTRHDRIEMPEVGKRTVKVMRNDFNTAVSRESFLQALQYGRGKVQGDAAHVGSSNQHEVQQPPITGAQVQNATRT